MQQKLKLSSWLVFLKLHNPNQTTNKKEKKPKLIRQHPSFNVLFSLVFFFNSAVAEFIYVLLLAITTTIYIFATASLNLTTIFFYRDLVLILNFGENFILFVRNVICRFYPM